MIISIEPKEIKHVQEERIMQQTAFWGEVKKHQGIKPLAYKIKAEGKNIYTGNPGKKPVADDLLVLLQPINQENFIAYIPYGPTLEPSEENQGLFLEELSEKLRSYLPGSCIMIRYDLPWASPWAKEVDYYDCNQNWIGPPAKRNQEFRFNFNTINWNLKKASTDILPSNTIFLDLNKDENELLNKMKPKTRYNIRLSLKKGVKVHPVGMESIDIWYQLYKETAKRNNTYLHDIHYFNTVLSEKANNANSPVETKLLLAEINGDPLAAMFLTISTIRGTYLYGASSSQNRQFMASYALQWEAIKLAKKKGCSEYDMFGIAPNPTPSHPLYGLYRYKCGFGGQKFHRLGCWDYPLDKEKYLHYATLEMCSEGYHVN